MPFGRGKDRMSRRGRDDFTQEPEEGWLHDDDALAMGEGVFYSFPVNFLGSVEIKQSLSGLKLSLRTEAIREMMARLMVAAGRMKDKKRKINAACVPYASSGEVTVAQLPVSLGIAADGMVVVPNTGLPPDPSKPPEIIFYHSMPMISIAAGGDAETYNLVCYVAKDDTGRREAYIFDCEEHSDEVLATLGQSFVLAQDFAAKKRAKPDKEKLKKEYLDVEAVYDTATDLSAMTITEEPASESHAIYDTASDLMPPAKAGSVNPTMVPPVEYDTMTAGPARPEAEAIYDVATTEIVKVLNKRDSFRRSMKAPPAASKKKSKSKPRELPPAPVPEEEDVDLNGVEQQDLSRPSWICISESTTTLPRADLGSLLSQFKAQAATIEEVDDE